MNIILYFLTCSLLCSICCSPPMNVTSAGFPSELVASNPMHIGPVVVPAALAGPPLDVTSPEKPSSLQNA